MEFGSGLGFNFMFDIFPIIFMIMFVIVIAVLIANAVKGISTWNENNNSPILTVESNVVAKRMSVTHHHDANNNMNHTTSSTSYYVTFQVESGDRIELLVTGSDYGMLVEGDKGKLTFQGTRYKGFQRNI